MKKILDDIRKKTLALDGSSFEVIERLARAVEDRDLQMSFHVVRMNSYGYCLAKKNGWHKEDCHVIMAASTLHDIGKIAVSEQILCKAGRLTMEEWIVMKTHTIVGAELLSGNPSRFFDMAKEIALTHHEKWDGSGYPAGLKGKEIPLAGRICCLCDVFDALMSKRPYKKAWPLKETILEIKKGRGRHFDPFLVDQFLEILPDIMEIRENYADPV